MKRIEERIGVGRANGTFGELLQGVLPNGENFLVTFPIDHYSTCEFSCSKDDTKLATYPASKNKSLQIAEMTLTYLNKPLYGKIFLTSQLEQGKGLASSTADMVATARAIENYYEVSIPMDILEKFIREIEPSDGIMYQGIVIYNHLKVELKEFLGDCPPLTILALDEGGEVDTVKFNEKPKQYTKTDKEEYEYLLRNIRTAFAQKDLNKLGDITTRSAYLNQKQRHKKTFNEIEKVCNLIGGIGVVAAHSGTYIGVLISDDDPNYTVKVKEGKSALMKLGYPIRTFNTLSSKEIEEATV